MKTPTEQEKQQFQRAMDEFRHGDPSKAIRLFEEVRASWQDDADILYFEGCAWGKLGQPDRVKTLSEQALSLKPDHFGSLCNLANALMLTGDEEGALENYEKARDINPDAPDVLNNYGKALGMLGRREEAIELYKGAVEKRPDYASAHASLGEAYSQGGQPGAAMQEFKLALELDPNEFRAHLGIGGLYTGGGGLEMAEHHYKEALRISGNSIEAHLGLANFEALKGNRRRALEILTDAENLGIGDDFVIAACKAECLEHLGEGDKAFAIVQELAEQDRMTPTAIRTYAKLCSKFGDCDTALEFIDMSAEAPSTDSGQRQSLFYAAGALLDKLGRYDEAFDYYRQANEAVEVPYRLDVRGINDRLIGFFSRDSLANLPRATTGSERPIFILGMPRSGTSLTEQILSSHPDVFGAGELTNLKQMGYDMCDDITQEGVGYLGVLDKLPAEELTTLASRYLDEISTLNSDCRFVTDKMPHNFQLIGLITILFPQARIIHCRRNPLDNGLSIYFQSFIFAHDYATDLAAIGEFYDQYDRLMRHWESIVDNPMLTVQYEDMVSDQEGMTRKLLEF